MSDAPNRILTTHAGSLPRPDALDDLDDALPAPADTLRGVLSRSVADVVAQQAEIGHRRRRRRRVRQVELDRLSVRATRRLRGAADRPAARRRWSRGQDRVALCRLLRRGARRRARSGTDPTAACGLPAAPTQWVCTGPITYIGPGRSAARHREFPRRAEGTEVAEAFCRWPRRPASSRVGANDYYASEEDYLFALAEAMHVEYERSSTRDSCCRSTTPGSPALWDRHAAECRLERVPPLLHAAHRRAQPRAARHP